MNRKRKAPKADTVRGEVQRYKFQDNACPDDTHPKPNAMDVENTVPSLRKKLNSNDTDQAVDRRRSGRLKSSELPKERQNKELVIEKVNPVENAEGEALSHQEVCDRNLEEEEAQNQQPVETVSAVHGRNLEEKVDHILQAVDAIKSKNFEQVTRMPNEGSSSDLTYKALYIDSQKRLEALMEKHHELAKELEYARGKISAYEKMSNAMASAKEVILVSRLEKDGAVEEPSTRAAADTDGRNALSR